MPNSSSITRSAFLKGLALSAVAPFLPAVQPAVSAELNITEIAPGVFVHQGRHQLSTAGNGGDICNLTLIVGKQSAAVIDTGGSLRIGREAREAFKSVTPKPIRYVINTHMHPDHVFGNAAFSDDQPEFIAHYKMARGLAARSERYLTVNRGLIGEAAFEGTKIVVPTREVKDTLDLDLGDRTITLTARPTAHTDNDLTVFDQTTRTFVLGDLLFAGHTPAIDGSILGWLKLIATLRAEKGDRVVPGHGPASMPWPDALLPLERYLRTIVDDVRAMIKAGKPISEAIKTAGYSEKNSWELFDDFHVRNVTAAFAELEWE